MNSREIIIESRELARTPVNGFPPARPFSNSALSQRSPFFTGVPNLALDQLSPRSTQPFPFPTQPYVPSTETLPNPAPSQLGPFPTQSLVGLERLEGGGLRGGKSA